MIYKISDSKYQKFLERIEKIKKKFDKNHVDFRFEELGQEKLYVAPYQYMNVHVVDVEGKIQHNGWEPVALIEHSDNGNVVKKFSNDYIIPKYYWETKPYCDHCGYNRARKYTVLLRKDGVFKQVGKSCLKEYTGIDLQRLASMMEVFELEEYSYEGYEYEGDDTFNYVDLHQYLISVTNQSIKHGFVSKSKAEELGVVSTSITAFQHLTDVDEDSELYKPYSDFVDMVVRWVDSFKEESDYFMNVKSIVKNRYVSIKNLGFAASIIPTYIRENRKNLEKTSEFLGEVGQKIQVSGKISKVYEFGNCYGNPYNPYSYGTSYIYKIVDENGNVLTWTTSKVIEAGEVNIIGTVKNHKEYRGEKQTVITRCKIIK